MTDFGAGRPPSPLIAGYPPGALRGLRVVDFGWAWAGAVCGQVLADFGAEVIKIESSSRLDPMRQGRPIIGTELDPEQNPVCHNVNRNKFSFGVSAKHPEGARLLRELVAVSDVVVENMTPGAMPRLGLAYEDLREVNPQLVMVSLPGVANSGPLAEVRSYGPVVSALSGLDGLVGYEGEEPQGFQQPIGDPNVGLHAAVAVLAALRHRRRSGEGQHILTSQLRSLLPMLGEAVAEYALTGRVPGPAGTRRRGYAPHGIFPSQGEDKWVSIAVREESEWRALCAAIERPQLAQDPRYADQARREENRAPLEAEIAAWTARRTSAEATEVLQAAGVAAAPCLDVAERFSDPHFNANGDVVTLEHPVLGTTFVYGSPWKTSVQPPGVWKRVPLLGEDTDAILTGVLGLSAAEVAGLRAQGAVE
jgi:benzylsuccinate CoA-transferase BbsF subunit